MELLAPAPTPVDHPSHPAGGREEQMESTPRWLMSPTSKSTWDWAQAELPRRPAKGPLWSPELDSARQRGGAEPQVLEMEQS